MHYLVRIRFVLVLRKKHFTLDDKIHFCGICIVMHTKHHFFIFELTRKHLLRKTFLVGAFSFKRKIQTITMASFFSFFFARPQSSSRMYHFLQKLIRLLRPSQAKSGQWKLSAKGPPFIFYLFYVTYKTGRDQRIFPFNLFSALCEILFENFLSSQKSPRFEFFDILQQKVR